VFGLCRDEILFARKPAVEGDLEGIASIELTLAIEHLIGEARVSRVTLTDETIGDEVRCTTGEAEFMAIEGVSMILHDDVGVGFKQGDDLLRGGHRFPMEDPPLGLIDHPMGELSIDLQGVSHLLSHRHLSGIFGEVSREESYCPLRIPEALAGDVQNIEVVVPSGVFLPGVHYSNHPSLGPLRVIGEGDIEALQLALGLGEDSGEHPNCVPQKARI
jgi:hypothetical protein